MNRRTALTTCGRALVQAAASIGLLLTTPMPHAQEPGGREILDRVERLLWGSTVQGEYEMSIATPRWR